MGTDLVTTTDLSGPEYKLLRPGSHPPRTGPTYQCLAHWWDLPEITKAASRSEFLAVDFETRGSDYSAGISIVGVGLAWDTGSAYLHWPSLYANSRLAVTALLTNHSGLIAHNVYFDEGVARACLSPDIRFRACTYSLAAHLANESPEQKWGLKHLMQSLLGWPESNEQDLDTWLVVNGWYRGSRRKDESAEALTRDLLAGTLHPEKAEMWRAPSEVLGKYCVLDAEACYLLYTEVFRPVLLQFPGLENQQLEFMHLVHLLVEQKIGGIRVDRAGLERRISQVTAGIGGASRAFLSLPEIEPHVQQIQQERIQVLREAEPEKYLRSKLGAEPEKYRKDGTTSKNWERWYEKSQLPPVLSKNWENWKQRLNLAESGQDPDYLFNLNSDQQLRDLLFRRLGLEPRGTTDTGEPSTAGKYLKSYGRPGELLVELGYLQKELGYLQAYWNMTAERDTIHPSFRTPGTVTGRLSSKEPNLQQVPKTKAVMSLFQASPGTVWIDIDFAALESVVAAEFSQDPNMLALYGDGVPENDIHLFVAAQVPGEMGDSVLKTGYRPIDPPPGTVGKAKKEAKRWRSIAKTVVYACQFGAGVPKVVETLEADGVYLDYREVELIHSTYWSTFAELKSFGKSLYQEWRRNRGWILNGLGRPMCIADNYTKDCLSRFIQSTGHDILVKYIWILTHKLDQRGLSWRPVIIDWHDATTVEVPEENVDEVVDIMNQSMEELNKQLGGTIRMRGTPTVGRDLAAIKEPEL